MLLMMGGTKSISPGRFNSRYPRFLVFSIMVQQTIKR